jgi:hypothetical protein
MGFYMIRNLVLIIWILSNIITWLYPNSFLLVVYAVIFMITIRLYNIEKKFNILDYVLFYTIILPPFAINVALNREDWLFVAFILLLLAAEVMLKIYHRMDK